MGKPEVFIINKKGEEKQQRHCVECKSTFQNHVNLLIHYRDIHKKRIKCNFCKFFDLDVKKHEQSVHGKKVIEEPQILHDVPQQIQIVKKLLAQNSMPIFDKKLCNDCDLVFLTEDDLENHVFTDHSILPD